MPSSDSSSSFSLQASPTEYLKTLLDSARPFFSGELESVDERLPSLVVILCQITNILHSTGASKCSHKRRTFLDHLIDVYRPFIHDNLLFCYTNSELVEYLECSEISLKNAKEKGLFDEEEGWRKKLRNLVPANGIVVKHIKTSEDVVVEKIGCRVSVDEHGGFYDQYFSFQDVLFENFDGKFEFKGNNTAFALWPGEGKSRLWRNSVSKMGAVYSLIVREEKIFDAEKKRGLVEKRWIKTEMKI
ncbi:hypothetical protein TorRG33x02_164380 [Trema orientale]|uniref:Uncharacterized protein n=1 Tax=Trema orientale TaxID=63057 RepID=A0A2P5EQA6_TREOI|nr:hypothetical protein TorRG33x02_164380 [Trema orientale]